MSCIRHNWINRHPNTSSSPTCPVSRISKGKSSFIRLTNIHNTEKQLSLDLLSSPKIEEYKIHSYRDSRDVAIAFTLSARSPTTFFPCFDWLCAKKKRTVICEAHITFQQNVNTNKSCAAAALLCMEEENRREKKKWKNIIRALTCWIRGKEPTEKYPYFFGRFFRPLVLAYFFLCAYASNTTYSTHACMRSCAAGRIRCPQDSQCCALFL